MVLTNNNSVILPGQIGMLQGWCAREVLASGYIQVPGAVVLLSNNVLPIARLTKISPFVL